jgi:hypothetical protein
MAHEQIIISREELYKKVWSTPMIKLAKQFNLSDRGLAKLCKRHKIPLPGLGYWAKLQHGKTVKQIPLPSVENYEEITITFLEKETEYIDEKQLTEANSIIRSVRNRKKRFSVSHSLINPHTLVEKSYKSLKNTKKNEKGILIPKNKICMDIHVSEKSLIRALCILDTLIKSLEKYGISIRMENGGSRKTYADILGESISFAIVEKHDLVEKEHTSEEKREKEYFPWSYPKLVYIPNGSLSLKIQGFHSYYLTGLRKQWTDGSKQKVEDCIGSFIIGLVKAAVKLRSENLRRAALHQKWEAERKRELELQRKREEEKQRIDLLIQHTNAWYESLTIRKYLNAVEIAAINKYGRIEQGSEMDLWLKWAYDYANKLDPLAE